MSDVVTPELRAIINQFSQSVQSCRKLFHDCAKEIIDSHPSLLPATPGEFLDKMDDLHRGLLIKLFVSIGGVDRVWTRAEEHLAAVLFFHLWHQQFDNEKLRETIRHLEREAGRLHWSSLVKPFKDIRPLHHRWPELETIVMRIGNMVAKADGRATSLELEELQSIINEIRSHAPPKSSQRKPHDSPEALQQGRRAIQQIEQDVDDFKNSGPYLNDEDVEVVDEGSDQPEKPTLEEALAELDTLIGLETVKSEVKTLVNVLRLQRKRAEAGLPETKISLHMVFYGNPGTGKTTVARIIGKIYGAMGILSKGHLIETDRSGLVAEYAGQTAPNTNKKIDEALDGVLFIDEAYSLVSETGDDAFGHEAIQTLLKRMEDDRDRLVVILAGYPNEMDRLLKSNPGLSSRIQQHIHFDDYQPIDMGRIFGVMCQHNQYIVPGPTQGKILLGFKHLYEVRDEHFGNGRLVRNVFEDSIRQLANRVVQVEELCADLLTRFEPEDIVFSDVPVNVIHEEILLSQKFRISCPSCETTTAAPAKYVGRKIKCKKCEGSFRIDWPHFEE